MNKQMEKKYDSSAVEKGKYDFWLENKLFSSGDKSKLPFTIVIPPPNVTGKLHLGHTWDNTLQDIAIRRKRMQGYDALYLPGMDHAGIATQAKVDAKLKNSGINRYDLGREEYLKVAWSWKEEYAGFIREQWKTMGLSLDYDKERFTLDEGLSKAVTKVFIDLYNKGYIYRGERIINWDCEAKTALSNIEIEHFEVEGALYYVKYPLVSGKGEIMVATTRPETMFADTAIMVHPEDERFINLHGEEVYIPTTKTKIKIITDKYVDKEFGTGIVKVTPAHDPNDFLVGKRHNLAMPLCMNEDGTMNDLAHKYSGLDRFECRKQVVKDLEELKLLEKIEKIKHSVGHSERTNVIVEPRLSKQWFVKMDELAKNALEKSEVEFIPERFSKTFTNWMEGIEDWCISRQLWWGHRIPVWYKGDEIYLGEEAPEEAGFVQDEDVLDTWFSSALWPFSTLGWPDKTSDYERYFKHCLIHGLIRDKDGKKMSKSLGNGVDPIEVIEKYGADALRYFITTNSSPGQDLRYEEEKVLSSWNYINKIWNISRYVLMNAETVIEKPIELDPKLFNFADKWIMNKLNQTIDQANSFFDRYEYGEAAKLIYNFTWHDFASWYVEMSKISDSETTKQVLVYVLTNIIKLLHPFMPFVTEEIFQKLNQPEVSIMISEWPKNNQMMFSSVLDKDWFFELIKEVRTIRNNYQVSWTRPIDMLIKTNASNQEFLKENENYLQKFLNPKSVVFIEDISQAENTLSIILAELSVYIPLGSLVDLQEEKNKLQEQLKSLEAEINRCEKMLNNPNFVNKAPEAKVNEEKQKLAKYQENYREVKVRIKELK
jgi:valyl-tRNA synthetase